MEKRIKKIINLTTLNKQFFFIMHPFELSVKPAYGRDYKNKKEILADYLANNDFELIGLSTKKDNL